jgi:hypothetical protein
MPNSLLLTQQHIGTYKPDYIRPRDTDVLSTASMQHKESAMSRWSAFMIFVAGVLPAGATFAQQEHFPPSAFLVKEQDPPGPDWQVASGMWSPSEGAYRSSGGGAADISTIVSYEHIRSGDDPTPNLPFEQFTYRARMFNEQGRRVRSLA